MLMELMNFITHKINYYEFINVELRKRSSLSRMTANKCGWNNGIRMSPFCNHHINN